MQVGNQATVLGFVGAPFTLASYIVEGGSSKSYTHIKRLAFGQPEVLHALLSKLADNIADYVRYQVPAQPLVGISDPCHEQRNILPGASTEGCGSDPWHGQTEVAPCLHRAAALLTPASRAHAGCAQQAGRADC